MMMHLYKNADDQEVTFTMLTTTDGNADKVKIKTKGLQKQRTEEWKSQIRTDCKNVERCQI